MGTNYYLHRNVCGACGRGDTPLHIGKSSVGWCFSLHVQDEIQSLEDWKAIWAEGVIKNEYGDVVPPEEMLEIITVRGFERPAYPNEFYASSEEFNRKNNAVDGPNGLRRHRVGPHCVGHGEGTWDLIPGEFS